MGQRPTQATLRYACWLGPGWHSQRGEIALLRLAVRAASSLSRANCVPGACLQAQRLVGQYATELAELSCEIDAALSQHGELADRPARMTARAANTKAGRLLSELRNSSGRAPGQPGVG